MFSELNTNKVEDDRVWWSRNKSRVAIPREMIIKIAARKYLKIYCGGGLSGGGGIANKLKRGPQIIYFHEILSKYFMKKNIGKLFSNKSIFYFCNKWKTFKIFLAMKLCKNAREFSQLK